MIKKHLKKLIHLFPYLGINNPDWDSGNSEISNGSAGLMLNLRDMVKLGQLYLQDGYSSADTQILSSEWIYEATSTQVETSWRWNGSGRYGYLWWLPDRGYLAWGLGGQFIVVIPELNLIIGTHSFLTDASSNHINILAGIIYPIVMGWQWGGGWLAVSGFSDFAGSTLVHSTGGAAALAGAIVLGARTGRFDKSGKPTPIKPFAASSIPLVTIGVFILWLGWFGFNGGSQLSMGTFDDAVAISKIFINTNLAACGGVLAAAIVTRLMIGKTDVLQMLNGAIGGLVAITAEPLMPTPLAAILIGSVGGIIVIFGTKLLFFFKIDDVVGAIPAHLFAGIWGTLVVPLTNPDASFSGQLLGVIAINVFVFVVSFTIWSIMKTTIGIRLSKDAEKTGTDVFETGVIAYAIRD